MRVLFFTYGFWPDLGGVETLTLDLLPELARQGFELLVVAPFTADGREEFSRVRGLPVRRMALLEEEIYRDPARLLGARQRLERIQQEFCPHVIHLNGLGRASILHCLGPEKDRPPTLLSVHGAWNWSGQPNSVVRRLLSRVDWVTACSSATLQACQQLCPHLEGRSSLLYNALRPALEQAEPVWPGHPQRQPVVLCAGRFRCEKGFDRALRAWPRVRAVQPQAELWLAGDGPEEPHLRQLAAHQPSVRFLGRRQTEDIQLLLRQSAALLVPSRQEGFGMVALEAIWSGTPVVACSVGGLPEVLDHGRGGVLLPDVPDELLLEPMAAALVELLTRPQDFGCMARRAHAHGRENFSWSRYQGEHRHLYQRLAGVADVVTNP